jgi:serine/threonine-protein kinase
MSPEICSGATVDARSDVYSLGAVIYFMLTGRTVFEGRGIAEILAAHVNRLPEPPSRHARVPADLDAVVMRCLAKRPEDRYPDMSALEEALGGCADAGTWAKRHAQAAWHAMRVPESIKTRTL